MYQAVETVPLLYQAVETVPVLYQVLREVHNRTRNRGAAEGTEPAELGGDQTQPTRGQISPQPIHGPRPQQR
jgi:hypothetical protein